MRTWRLCKPGFSALDGEGAKLYGGRWNDKGIPLVYTSIHLSLAVLELLVHTDADLIPGDLVSLEIEIPDGVPFDQIGLPAVYLKSRDENLLKRIGTRWARERRSAVLIVPSIIVLQESNALINPLHPDAKRIKTVTRRPFRLDPRLL